MRRLCAGKARMRQRKGSSGKPVEAVRLKDRWYDRGVRIKDKNTEGSENARTRGLRRY